MVLLLAIILIVNSSALLGMIIVYLRGYFPRGRGSLYSQNFDTVSGTVSLGMLKDIVAYSISIPKEREKLAVVSLYLEYSKISDNDLDSISSSYLEKEIGLRIKNSVRVTDFLAKTKEGVYFLILPRILNTDNIEVVIERLLKAFEKPFLVNEVELVLTPRVGISVYPDNSKDIDTLFNNAHVAMMRIKNNHYKNYYFYNDDFSESVLGEGNILHAINEGIKNNEFVLFYQPKFTLKSNKVTGVEALVRWNHPKKGLLSPHQFIDTAENSGLIVPLGYWVLRESCRQHKQWGIEDLKMSVNLSAYQFRQTDLVVQIKRILKEEGMNPHNLDIEITETTSMSDINVTLGVLRELRAMGISVSIDDFGTGYSSLAYLKKFPITTLKVDRSFVLDIFGDKSGEVVIQSIINMAKGLKLNVVAEGVETLEQLQYLKDISCDEIQGYLISPPIPSNDFLVKWKENKFISNIKKG